MQISQLPSPPGLPLIGHFLQFKKRPSHQAVESWCEAQGELLRVKLAGREFVVVANADLIRQVLNERPHIWRRSTSLDTVFGDLGLSSVFAAEGERWRRLRRLWIQALNSHQIQQFVESLGDITERLRGHWLAAAQAGQPVDVQADLMRYTVDVTTLMAFGHDGNTLGQKGEVIQDDLHHIFPMLSRRLTAPFPYWRYIRLPRDRELDKAMQATRKFVAERIAEARARIADDPTLEQTPGNLLEAFLVARDEDGSPLSDQEIEGNTLTALLAGEDTTANTLAWSMHFLAQYPEVQRKLQEEADSVLGDTAVCRDVSAMKRLPYADAVMAESMRLKPVAPLFFLTALKNSRLGQLEIPSGTNLILSMRYAARQPEKYHAAAHFRPERWLGETAPRFEASAPTPFGAGPRICPGRNLAQMEVRAVLSMLGRQFKLAPARGAGDVTESFAFTMGPANLRLHLSTR